MAVARLGERATPPVPAPALLRRYLRFARLPDPALDIARRVLEDDPAFRVRVGEATTEAQLGRAGWVWLTRPAGWELEFEAIRKQANAAEVATKVDRAEREATRRLVGAEAALARMESQLSAASDEAARLTVELGREHEARRELTEEVLALRSRVEELVAERGVTIARAKDYEARVAQRNAELREARHQHRMLGAELENALAGLPPGVAPSPPPRRKPLVAAVAPPEPLDREALTRALLAAGRAAAELSSIIAAAAGLLDPPTAGDDVADRSGPESAAPPPSPRRTGRVVGTGRRPVALPPGFLDDGPEAAEHLVRAPGALVLVDGYNVSQTQWSAHPVAEQRVRLLDACAELHARTGVAVEVVFDGTGDMATSGALTRQAVRYHFTPAGVEADDVVLARIGDEPADRPVLVASSDGRVRDGARRLGANVLSASQYLTLLRRA